MNLTALHVTIHVQPGLGGMGKRLLGDGVAARRLPVDEGVFHQGKGIAVQGKRPEVFFQVEQQLRGFARVVLCHLIDVTQVLLTFPDFPITHADGTIIYLLSDVKREGTMNRS